MLYCLFTSLSRARAGLLPQRLHLLLLLLSGCIISVTLPQQVLAQAQLKASASTSRVEVNAPIRLNYEVIGGSGSDFRLGDLNGFAQVSGVSQMSSTSINNGRVTTQQRYTVDVVAMRPGTYTIDPASVFINGQRVESAKLQVEVVEPPPTAQSSVAPGKDVAFRFVPSKTRVYIGERLRISGELLNRVDVYTYRMHTQPEFGNLRTEQLKSFNSNARIVDFGGQSYQVQRIFAIDAYATQPGSVTIDPHALTVNIVDDDRGRGSFFFGPRTRAEKVVSPPVKIEVLPLPTPKPPSFSGAVGRWQFEGRFDDPPAQVTTQDALVFRLTAQGYGDATRLDDTPIQWPAGWRAYPVEIGAEATFETDTGIIARREFIYTIVPEQPGSYRLAPSLSWFDVGTERYETYTADTLELEVTGAAVSAAETAAVAANGSAQAEVYRGKPRVVGSFWITQPWYWLLFLAGPLIMMGWRYRQQLRQGLRFRKTAAATPNPLAEGRARLLAARAAIDDPTQFYDELARALDGFAQDRLGLSPSEQDAVQVRKAFAKTLAATPAGAESLAANLTSAAAPPQIDAAFTGSSNASGGASGAASAQVLAEAFLEARELAHRGRFGGGIDRAAREQALHDLEQVLSA